VKGVAITGTKGGTGKTALSHALALGAAWHQLPAYLLHTDNRDPIQIKGRPYAYYDAREPSTLQTLASAALNQDGLFIIDGGGNRPQFDTWIAQSMDLVLIPVSPDPEDVREAIAHAKRMEQAGAVNIRFVINKYPAHRNEREFVSRYLNLLPQEKIIGHLGEVKMVRALRDSDNPEFQTPPSRVNNLARSLYRLVSDALDDQETFLVAAVG
jgi:cellulose biosynthesis protein BcsQ